MPPPTWRLHVRSTTQAPWATTIGMGAIFEYSEANRIVKYSKIFLVSEYSLQPRSALVFAGFFYINCTEIAQLSGISHAGMTTNDWFAQWSVEHGLRGEARDTQWLSGTCP